ncbi:unnamed protein product [Pieris brassicae]|uniref:Uncharacterized protein n=1 Tax=Pieris brassicae TaxID=7116 RepID=A0A9P0TUX0_PIEBR|nr:unnamed protein product [Pieris brassicae]
MDDWERHVTPLLQDMGCSNEAQDDFFHQQDVSVGYPGPVDSNKSACWLERSKKDLNNGIIFEVLKDDDVIQ